MISSATGPPTFAASAYCVQYISIACEAASGHTCIRGIRKKREKNETPKYFQVHTHKCARSQLRKRCLYIVHSRPKHIASVFSVCGFCDGCTRTHAQSYSVLY